LIAPVALEEQVRFAIREGGRTVGAGYPVDYRADGSRCRSDCFLWKPDNAAFRCNMLKE